MPIRSKSTWTLWNSDEQSCLRRAQMVGLPIEIYPRGRSNTFQIAAHGRQGEIHGQDFALGEPGLKLHSSGNVGYLANDIVSVRREQAGKLRARVPEDQPLGAAKSADPRPEARG